MSYILSGDATVYYEEYGTGESLVLIPGLLGTIESDWRRFIPDLARHHHTIAVDLRGHGRTNNPQRSLSLEQLVLDLRNLCDTLEIQRPFFCTHGVAAHVPLAYCRKHPASIGGLVLHAPLLASAGTDVHRAVEELKRYAPPDELRRRHTTIENDRSLHVFVDTVTSLVEEFKRDQTGNELRWNVAPVLITGGDRMEGAAIEHLRQLAGVSGRIALEILSGTGALPGTIQKLPFVNAASAFISRAAGDRGGLELDAESSS